MGLQGIKMTPAYDDVRHCIHCGKEFCCVDEVILHIKSSIWWSAVVNANLSEFERLNDVNHQYPNDKYCVKCGHYPEVSMMRDVDCECDCHD